MSFQGNCRGNPAPRRTPVSLMHEKRKSNLFDEKLLPDGVALADKDAADLLYRYGIGGAGVSILASSGLAFVSIGQASAAMLWAWWGVITSVLLFRCADIYRYRLKGISIRGRQAVRHFGYGIIITAALWAAFPLLFFNSLTLAGKNLDGHHFGRHGGR